MLIVSTIFREMMNKPEEPDPCGGSQACDISRNFSSSCITVRPERYCLTLRDIMVCVVKKILGLVSELKRHTLTI